MARPVGPYASSRRAGPFVVCSGQIGLEPEPGPGGPVLAQGLAAQTRRAMANVAGVLAGEGLGWEHVVKTTVFLADIADYAEFNALYVEALGDHRPARSVVAVAGLPLGALVEVEAWAYAG
jgi:2-iminobutanoate/2-iminopropanoate deaminase